MPAVITRTAYLAINGVPLATPAWRVLDLSVLYGLNMVGTVESMPYTEGGIAYAHRVTWRSVTLPLLVMGGQTFEGGTYSNVYAGLDDNIDYLLENVVVPDPTGAPRSAVWYRATGDTLEADVYVGSFERTSWGRSSVQFGLELVIPAGRFAAPEV